MPSHAPIAVPFARFLAGATEEHGKHLGNPFFSPFKPFFSTLPCFSTLHPFYLTLPPFLFTLPPSFLTLPPFFLTLHLFLLTLHFFLQTLWPKPAAPALSNGLGLGWFRSGFGFRVGLGFRLGNLALKASLGWD